LRAVRRVACRGGRLWNDQPFVRGGRYRPRVLAGVARRWIRVNVFLGRLRRRKVIDSDLPSVGPVVPRISVQPGPYLAGRQVET